MQDTKKEMIDWARVARPQDDGYDNKIALMKSPLVRLELGEPTICNGRIAVRPISRSLGWSLIPAESDHPNIQPAIDLLALWPAALESFCQLIYLFYPLNHPDIEDNPLGRGSTCGSTDTELGEMYATVYSVEGLAEAFAHELGHTKLRYLGVRFEEADRLIANSPDELFVSPIRKDKLRPMSAVMHAQYSYTYITALDLKMFAANPNEGDLQAIKLNYGRLLEGEREIKAHLKTDAEGEQFFTGYFAWLDEILNECKAIIDSSSSPTE
jgi:hypothetical protein